MKKLLFTILFATLCGTMAVPVASAQGRHGNNHNGGRFEQSSGNSHSGRNSSALRSHDSGQNKNSAIRPAQSSGHSSQRPGLGTSNGNVGTQNRPTSGNNWNHNNGNNHSNRPTVGNGNNGNNRPNLGNGNNGNHWNHNNGSNNNRPSAGNAVNNRPGLNDFNHNGNHSNPGNNGNHNNRPGVGNNGNHIGNNGYRPGNSHVTHRPPMMTPPHRPYRPVMMRPHMRPVPPRGWRPASHVPILRGILGLTFGTAINLSLDYLFNSGYTVDGYTNDVVYLRNVNAMNYIWTDAALYYGNGGLDASAFYYSTPRYDLARYNNVYNSLVATYGMPVTINNTVNSMSATWFGGNNGYITLSFGPNTMNTGLRYLTTLTVGL